MRYQDDINTEHNMKSICCAAVAQWPKRLTRNGYTRVRNWKGANIYFTNFCQYLWGCERSSFKIYSKMCAAASFHSASLRSLLEFERNVKTSALRAHYGAFVASCFLLRLVASAYSLVSAWDIRCYISVSTQSHECDGARVDDAGARGPLFQTVFYSCWCPWEELAFKFWWGL